MRDGIYRVDFISGRPETQGIAMLRAGLFKGINEDRGFTGSLGVTEGAVRGQITFRDASAQVPPSFSVAADDVGFKGVETPDGFDIHGMSEREARKEYKLRATWIAELRRT